MQVVTDSGTDVNLPQIQAEGLEVHMIPLVVTLDGKSYREGIDIEPEEFYKLLAATEGLPITSQPSSGVFAETYRRLAASDPEILSIHISSGLSGTVNAARAGAAQVPEAHVTIVDTKTLSGGAGWQVEAALRAVRAGWPLEKILALMKRIGDATDSLYTLKELKYLIHGGRISHFKGLIASLLDLKPLIGVEKVHGKYEQHGQARTFNGAVKGLVDLIAKQHAPGSALRTQVLYSFNPEGGELLRQFVNERFECTWLPMGPMSLVLGAHTGPSMVGVAYAPASAFEGMP